MATACTRVVKQQARFSSQLASRFQASCGEPGLQGATEEQLKPEHRCRQSRGLPLFRIAVDRTSTPYQNYGNRCSALRAHVSGPLIELARARRGLVRLDCMHADLRDEPGRSCTNTLRTPSAQLYTACRVECRQHRGLLGPEFRSAGFRSWLLSRIAPLN